MKRCPICGCPVMVNKKSFWCQDCHCAFELDVMKIKPTFRAAWRELGDEMDNLFKEIFKLFKGEK